MNNFTIAGRICRNLELRYSSESKPIINVTLAVNNGKDDTSFITTTFFGKTAEIINEYCTKGDVVGIQGIIKNHNWEDKDGNKRYEYQFIGNKINFLASKKKEEETPQDDNQVYKDFGEQIEIDESEMPF